MIMKKRNNGSDRWSVISFLLVELVISFMLVELVIAFLLVELVIAFWGV